MTPLRDDHDDELVRRFRAGEEAAFEALHARYRPRLEGYAARILMSADDAQDAVQDAFVRAHAVLRSGDAPVRVGPWLHRVVHNRCIDLLRAREAGLAPQADSEAIERAAAPAHGDPHAAAVRRERLAGVVAAVRELPDRQRDALVASALDGRTHADIARGMQTSVLASKMLVSRGRTSVLRTALQRGFAGIVAPFAKLAAPGVVAVALVTTPAVLIGGGKIVDEDVFGPGDPAPRTSGAERRGERLDPHTALVEASIELPAGEPRPRPRVVRLTCPHGHVVGGLSAAGGPHAPLTGAALRNPSESVGRRRRGEVRIVPRANLSAPAVVKVGVRCVTPGRFAVLDARGKRLECAAFRAADRAGQPVPRRALARCRSTP